MVRSLVLEALEARTEIEHSPDWRALLQGRAGGSCTVVVFSEQNRADFAAIVREVLPDPPDEREIAGRPFVFVDIAGWLEEYSRLLQWIARPVVRGKDVPLLLWDSIQQECARAALSDAWFKVQRMQRCPEPLTRVFRVVLRSERPVVLAREAAKRAGCHRSTMYEHWERDLEKNLPLKDFVDMALLLHARRLKTKMITWLEVARMCGTNPQHLREISHRWMQSWPGDRDGEVWVRFADMFRATFTPLLTQRGRNA